MTEAAEGEHENENEHEREGLGATFHEKVIALDTMGLRLLTPTAVAIAVIVASAILLATRDADWPLVSAGEISGSTLSTVPLPVVLLTTITLILAWSFVLAGALHAHLVVRIITVGAYVLAGVTGAIETGTPGTVVIVLLALLSVVVVAIGLGVTDLGNRSQAPHLHHRARLRLPTFGWVVFATALIYGLFTVTGLQRGQLGFFIDAQLQVFQFLLIPVLILAGTDFAEWAEVVGGRLSLLVERLPSWAMRAAILVAAAGTLTWAYVLQGGPGFSLLGTLTVLLPVAVLALPVCAVGGLGLWRPTSTRVPFWALGIGAIALYVGILAGAAIGPTAAQQPIGLPPLVTAQAAHPERYSLLVPQAWTRTPVADGVVWSGVADGRPARLVLLWNGAETTRSLSGALAAPVDLESEGTSDGWGTAAATTTVAAQTASGEVWTQRVEGNSWTLAGVRQSGLTPVSRSLFEAIRGSFTTDPGAPAEGDSSGNPFLFVGSESVAAAVMLGLGLVLLLVGRGEVATGGLFLALAGFFTAFGALVAPGVFSALGVSRDLAVSPSNLDAAGAYGGILLVLLTSIVPGWRLPPTILRLVLVLVLGFTGLHFLYDGVFGTALSAGARFTILQGLILVAAMLWDVLMSGESFTNTGGLRVPRHTRVLVYMGYTMLVVTTVLFFSSVQIQGGGTAGQEFESDQFPQIGIAALGPPLLVTFFLVNLSAWRRARPLGRPDSLDQVDRSILEETDDDDGAAAADG